MKILGRRILVEKVEEEKKEGDFQTVDVLDSFIFKGRVVQIGAHDSGIISASSSYLAAPYDVGDVVIFAKYSPDTQEVEHDGKKYKIVAESDVLAVL